MPALLVREVSRYAVDDKASEVEHDFFSDNMDVVKNAVVRTGSCIAACLKIEESLSELSEWPFLVELVRGYRASEGEDTNDNDDIEGVFEDECKMFKDLREVWIDRLANVAVGKSCDALVGYRSCRPALRLHQEHKRRRRSRKYLACVSVFSIPNQSQPFALIGIPVLRAWLALLHKSLDSRAFQRAWRKICKIGFQALLLGRMIVVTSLKSKERNVRGGHRPVCD